MEKYKKQEIGDFFNAKTKDFEKSPPDFVWENIKNTLQKQSVAQTTTATKSSLNNKIILSVVLGMLALAGGLLYYVFNNKTSSTGNISKPDNTANREVIEKTITNTQTAGTSKSSVVVNSQNGKAAKSEEKNADNSFSSSTNIPTASKSINSEAITPRNAASKENEKKEITKDIVKEKPEGQNVEEIVFKIGKNSKKQYFLNISKIHDIKSLIINDINGKEVLKMKPSSNFADFMPINISNMTVGSYSMIIETKTGIVKKKFTLTE
ncbi:MAG: hypothetical protein Q8880_00955 [Bacteroidota bacterium]|nr:hypothetical protein [Bacteroidota bacterium]